jgi:oligopeptide transport system substrate-binding protein
MRLTKWIFFAYLAAIAAIIVGIALSFTVKPQRDPHTLYLSYVVNLKSMDPAICNDVDGSAIIGNVYECLLNYKYGVKGPYQLIPQLAAELPQVSPDSRTYTIKLRRGIRFYDPWKKAYSDGIGPEMKAADVIYSFKRVADFSLASPNFSTLFQDKIVGIDDWFGYTQQMKEAERKIDYDRPVEGLQALDDYTLQIRLVDKNPQFKYLLAYLGSAIVCRHAVETYGDDFRNRPVGTGPYAMSLHEPEQRIVFVANPIYRGRPDIDGNNSLPPDQRMPFIKRIEYSYYSETLPAWYFLQHGQLDVGGIPKETFDEAIDPATLKLRPAMEKRGFRLRTAVDPSIFYIGFNMTDPVVGRNRPLRQAMAMAIDREKYIRIYLNGRGSPANGPIPPTFDAYDANDVNPYAQLNLKAARARLDEAQRVNGGPLPTLTLSMGDTTTDARQTAEFFISQWRQIGLSVKAEYNTWARFQELIDDRKLQIFMGGWLPDYPDEQTFLQLFYGKFAAPGNVNSTAYDNPAYDRIYESAIKMEPSPQRLKLYKQLVSIVNGDCPWIDLYYPMVYRLYWKWIAPYPTMDYGSGFVQYIKADFALRTRMLNFK